MNNALIERFLNDIGFNSIRDWLSKKSLCSTNKESFLNLSPHSNKDLIIDSFKGTQELLNGRRRSDTLPIREVSKNVDQAISLLNSKQSKMETFHFFEIYSLIVYGFEVKKFFQKEHFKIWKEKFSSISNFESLQKKTLTIFDESFNIRYDASKELKHLSRELQGFETKQFALTSSLIKKYQENGFLESDKERMYRDRTVLSVKNKFKNKVSGIIQGYSRSSQTTFIEPIEIIEINNDMQSTKQKIYKEHIRILTEITNFYQGFTKEIIFLVEAIKSYDWFFTLSSMAYQINSIEPSFASSLELKKFRNPILELNGNRPVELDLAIETKQKMVMISGPNAGGKTVTLKSIGLASAMAQSGLLVPGSTVKLRFFEYFFSDIGDNQSIENNLSTFSAHASNISKILSNIKSKKCLVLIDEIGSATDPSMGSALSQAICETLIKK